LWNSQPLVYDIENQLSKKGIMKAKDGILDGQKLKLPMLDFHTFELTFFALRSGGSRRPISPPKNDLGF